MLRPSRTAAAVALSLSLGLASASSARAADLLSTVRGTHEITIGTSNDAPFSFIDKDKGAVGIFPDVLRGAFARMGLTVEIKPVAMPFASLIPALTSGRIDVIGDSMYATAARKQVVDFTDILFFNPEALDVAKGNPLKLRGLPDLCGRVAGSYEGTTYVTMLRKASAACPEGKGIDMRQFPTIDNAFADLSTGRLDAVVAASSLSAHALQQNPALNFEIVVDYTPLDRSSSGSAIGVAKGNDPFLAAYDKAYGAMLADGTVAQIFTRWGMTPTDFFLAR